MTTYQVQINDEIVWEDETDGYAGWTVFPEGYRKRPESGEVYLIVDGDVIACQRTLEADIAMRAEAEIAAAAALEQGA